MRPGWHQSYHATRVYFLSEALHLANQRYHSLKYAEWVIRQWLVKELLPPWSPEEVKGARSVLRTRI